MTSPADTDQAHYDAGEIYSVPAEIADRFVRERVAKYVHVEMDDEPKPKKRSSSGKPWRETVRAGDTFQWQIDLDLPAFHKARITVQADPDDPDFFAAEVAGLTEVGGDGKKPSNEQAAAVDYLSQQAAALYAALLESLIGYANTFRKDWETNAPDLVGQILPHDLDAAQMEQRVAFTNIYFSSDSRQGVAYVEVTGDCVWDPDHGFTIICHRDRIVEVTQQGAGWQDNA